MHKLNIPIPSYEVFPDIVILHRNGEDFKMEFAEYEIKQKSENRIRSVVIDEKCFNEMRDNLEILKLENFKLCSMRHTWQENDAKLRELVSDMYCSALVNLDFAERLAFIDEFVERLRELEIIV